MSLEERILMANLKATEKYLHELGQGSYSYYVRQALDKLYPNWREEK